MFPVILEVIISLIVVYFLLSTVVSFVKEIIAMLINSRGKILYKSLEHLFVEDKPTIIDAENEYDKNAKIISINQLYESDYINNLASRFSISKKLNKRPSYIETQNFVSALIDEIQKSGTKKTYAKNSDELKKKIDTLKNNFIKTKLLEIITDLEETQQANISNIKTKIAEWFDNYMNTVTVIYKNYVTVWVFVISFFVCFSMNIDSLVLIEYFFENKAKREVVLSFAENFPKEKYSLKQNGTESYNLKEVKGMNKEVLNDFISFDLPYGWSYEGCSRLEYEANILGNKSSSFDWIKKIMGLFITTISLTLGAPFWYQIMVNLLALRKSVSEKK